MDDLYGGWDGLERAWPRLLKWVLQPLRAGIAAEFRAFDWGVGRFSGPWVRVAPGRPVIVEGCGSAPRAADGVAALIVWVEAPAEECWRRLMARDGPAATAHLRSWLAGEAEHHAREGTRARAEAIVDCRDRPGDGGECLRPGSPCPPIQPRGLRFE
jgi:hypothetical protein